ncbi:DNA damage-inducible transcript 4-like protein [Carcharodon carcharias]|uniref:DNA damage-inducible transcript 4-like protein n=1 Tax=Carcharodon carcharias TaxID=13397 RepID=UPI001B7F6E0B|nr:DNA damage-inducible transcript 4-like protein [Carcharodon carcharias]XP_041047287.1 DNA damage-inducible transcript 4-like protein [Carcharodon carcharias]XP_041047296.1 DNA damage-inducible transcript 4-like protein [Carcharodon carcharias]
MVASCSNNKSPDCVSELWDGECERPAALGNAAGTNYWDHEVAANNVNEEEQTCLYLTKLFENSLSRAKKTKLNCSEVLVPERLIRKIARDVLCLSSSEPCGLRGSIIYINMEIENMCKKLDRIVYDSSVVPTFELTLIFKQDGNSWPSLRDFFFIGTCFTPGFRQALKLSPGFCLIKKKLYSSSARTVIEC